MHLGLSTGVNGETRKSGRKKMDVAALFAEKNGSQEHRFGIR
jgi:hypothetical protein